jgi:hypothetical protein
MVKGVKLRFQKCPAPCVRCTTDFQSPYVRPYGGHLPGTLAKVKEEIKKLVETVCSAIYLASYTGNPYPGGMYKGNEPSNLRTCQDIRLIYILLRMQASKG